MKTHTTLTAPAIAVVCLTAIAALAPISAASNPIFVNVEDYGASPDNKDNTAQIQAAINTGRKAVVPPGDYAINGTLTIASKQSLHLAHGAWLRRLAANTDSTKPVVRLTADFSRLTGEGPVCGVISENASGGHTGDGVVDNGVINVGPEKPDQYTNINWWVIDSICIRGSAAAWNAYYKKPYPEDVDKNELITLTCGQGLAVKRGSCYNGRISNCLFMYSGIAIKANPICNGNMFANNHFDRITHSCYFSDDTTENLFSNCFVHGDPGVTVIRLVDTQYNHCYGIMAEPGATSRKGRYTRFCDISANSAQNVIIGQGNTGHAYINKSKSSLIITHAQLSHDRKVYFGRINTGTLKAKSITAETVNPSKKAETSSE